MHKPARRRGPRVTVAAIIEEHGRFLLVEEETPEGLRLNNPAGHVEPGESPEQAVVREALEETAHEFAPEAVLGLYLSRFVRPARGEDVTYLRIAYRGRVGAALAGRALDRGILRTLWLTPDEIRAERARHRSPLVMRCIEDHLAGRAWPLALVTVDATLTQPEIKHALAPHAHARGNDRARRDNAHPMHDRTDPAPGEDTNVRGGSPPDAPPGVPSAVWPSAPDGPAPVLAVASAAPDEAAQATADATPSAPLGTTAAAALAQTPAGGTSKSSAGAPAEPTLAQIAARLAERFPALFAPGTPRPIKLRIHADIQQRAPGLLTRRQLAIFLHRHTTSSAYLRALATATQRFDLDGAAAGEVTAEHREAAAAEVQRRRQIVEQRRADERAARRGPRPGSRPDSRPAAQTNAGAATAEAAGGDDAPAAAGGAPGASAQAPRLQPGRPERPPRRRDAQGTEGTPRSPDTPRREHGDAADRRAWPPDPRRRERAAPHGGAPARGGRHEPRPPRDNGPREAVAARQAPAPGPEPLPDDPARRERALLLRAWEGSPLKPASFCALKGLDLAEFEARIELARRERAERRHALARGQGL